MKRRLIAPHAKLNHRAMLAQERVDRARLELRRAEEVAAAAAAEVAASLNRRAERDAIRHQRSEFQ